MKWRKNDFMQNKKSWKIKEHFLKKWVSWQITVIDKTGNTSSFLSRLVASKYRDLQIIEYYQILLTNISKIENYSDLMKYSKVLFLSLEGIYKRERNKLK